MPEATDVRSDIFAEYNRLVTWLEKTKSPLLESSNALEEILIAAVDNVAARTAKSGVPRHKVTLLRARIQELADHQLALREDARRNADSGNLAEIVRQLQQLNAK